jgi:hypothetical protein
VNVFSIQRGENDVGHTGHRKIRQAASIEIAK